GGDCLNTGCVPSKALIAAAAKAQAQRDGAAFGVAAREPEVDFGAVMDHVHGVIAAIAPHDSQERFEGLGVRVIRERGRFTGPREVEAGAARIRARRFVIATGSRPRTPDVPGLAETPHLTNETVFGLRTRPRRLVVLGAGPIGLELAQAFRRLGSEVVVLEPGRALAKEDPELAAVALARLRAEGVEIREGATPARVERAGSAEDDGVRVALADGGTVEGSHLLVAAGRTPTIEGLGLEAAGVETAKGAITVDARLRTSNRKIFAIGDVTGGLQFTHAAGYDAGVVIRNALFRIPAKASAAHMPWATYTDPEIAQAGLTEAAATAQGLTVETIVWRFKDNDRAQAERDTDGMVKVVATPKGKVLGAGVVGPHAGELIQIWALALSKGLTLKDLTGMIAPYPTLGEASKRAAGQFFAPKLFGPTARFVVRSLLKLG
ncbi:MAG: FAD-dependent oxidoreductase, partial [Pseudomonadota bacterium]